MDQALEKARVKPKCCHNMDQPDVADNGPACHPDNKPDWFMRVCLSLVVMAYGSNLFFSTSLASLPWLEHFTHSVFELLNTMWWGLLLGIFMVALLSRVPREFVMSVLGTQDGLRGILRATAAGLLLDLCNHGILMVGAKLYERGASIGQVIAFLVASPWNSFSLTLILIALIGLPWTLAFIVFSMLIAVIAGLAFDSLVKHNKLPGNPNQESLPDDFRFWPEARKSLAGFRLSLSWLKQTFIQGIRESGMVLRWIFFGVLLASLIRAVVTPEFFANYFGPTAVGLVVTLIAATIIEVCSEGSTPIAADILTRAGAPGNSFAFLMTGASTDYTEIMVLKDTTRSWKIALFLPLLTVPQVIIIAWLMNMFA